MNKNKGFTIIELIVVIAIIAVLASIVLVNVTQYIAKGRDAAIKGNYSSLMTNAAQYFDLNAGAFGSGFIISTYMQNTEAAVTTAKGTPMHAGSATTQDWCACSPEVAPVVATTVYCVDNTGTVLEKASATGCAGVCLATGLCQ